MTKAPTTRTKTRPIEALAVAGADIARAARDWLSFFKPKRRVALSEWMAENARLDDGAKFRAFPFQNAIADAFTDPDVKQVTVRKSSRIGYSTIVQGFIAYCIARDPRRLLIYQPTIDDAEKYSRDDLDPVLQWPAVRAVATFKARHRDNQIRAKRFKGGWIQIKGANSPKEFRRVTADDVLLEEPDGYPFSAREEGDPARLAFKRNLTSPRRFSAAGSTPKIKGASRIDALFELGTQEYRYVPCPHCGEQQPLVFGDGSGTGLRWAPKEKPTEAWYQCVNGCRIDEADKVWMDENGSWLAHNPDAGPAHRSFHIWAAYSQFPGAAWLEIAKEFMEVRKDPNLLKTFVNQVLGLAYEEKGEAPEWERLYERRETSMQIGTPPAWAGILVGGIDVQRGSSGANRLEMDVWAFGPGGSRAFVEHIDVEGDLANKATWAKLDREVKRSWTSEDGRQMRLARVGIDSGDGAATMKVYEWARRNPGFAMALKGREGLSIGMAVAGPTWQDLTIGGRKIKKGVRLWTVATSMLKLELYGQLNLPKPVDGEDYPEGYVYLPAGTTDEWIKQLVAEQLVEIRKRNGKVRREWQQLRDRNEALDNAVYARAVAIAIGIDRWKDHHWAEARGEHEKPVDPAPKPVAAPPPAKKQSPAPASRPIARRPNNPFTSRRR